MPIHHQNPYVSVIAGAFLGLIQAFQFIDDTFTLNELIKLVLFSFFGGALGYLGRITLRKIINYFKNIRHQNANNS